MRKLRQLLGIAAALFLTFSMSPVEAKDVLGRSVIDGKPVELLTDKTWRFSTESSADGCTPLDLGVRFCDSDDKWIRTDFASPEVAAQYRVDDRHYAQFVLEGLGSDDGFTETFMRRAVIENAANAAGVPVSEIAVLDISATPVADFDGETAKYLTEIDGLGIMFFNTVLVLEKRTFQLITYSINREVTDNHLALHEDFLSRVRID